MVTFNPRRLISSAWLSIVLKVRSCVVSGISELIVILFGLEEGKLLLLQASSAVLTLVREGHFWIWRMTPSIYFKFMLVPGDRVLTFENLLFLINILMKLSICSGALNEIGSCFAQVCLDLGLGDFPPSASQVAGASLL